MRSRLPALAAGLLVVAGLTWDLGGYALLEPDEGRNAEVMREIATEGPWWLPRLNGLPYVDKPILHFAAGAAALRAFGTNETAARLPALVFTLGTILVVGAFARRTIGPEAGWHAALITAATPFTLAYARTVIFDATLTLCLTAALAAFFLAVDAAERDAPADRWTLAAWAAVGLGVLTKGPVALAVPLLVAVPYAVWRRRVWVVLDPTGLLLLLALVLPWVFAMSTVVPDFLRYVLFVETAQRLGSDVLGRTEPWWYFLPIFAAAALPWSVVLARAAPHALGAWRAHRIDPRVVYGVLWILVPLLLFSVSRSKRPQYMLPLIPPVGLLIALWWSRSHDRLGGIQLAGTALLVFGGALLALAPAIPGWLDTRAGVGAAIGPTAVKLGIVTLVSGAVAFGLAARGRWALPALVFPVAAIPFVSMPLMDRIGEDRSSRAAATAVRPFLTAETEVIAVATYPLSLSFYLERTLTLATADGRELTSNYITRRHERLRT
ncbi:MAG: glycosyltransferase family 39 protein, partial [Gemmatimonadota bacterium]|nr:glycosyltransferase family 39 protein [Gemmatimonadota bacterium]